MKAKMVCFGLEPGAAEWKVQTNPVSYGGTPLQQLSFLFNLFESLPLRSPLDTTIFLTQIVDWLASTILADFKP